MRNYHYDFEALVDALLREKELRSFLGDLYSFNLTCSVDRQIEHTMLDPQILPESKHRFYREILEPHLGASFNSFMIRLIENGDAAYYHQIVERLLESVSRREHLIFVEVASTLPLNREQLTRIRAQLGKMSGRHELDFFVFNTLSQDLVGGFTATVEGRRIDLSLKRDLERLHDLLVVE